MNALIVGMGESGRAAAGLLLHNGYRVYAADDDPAKLTSLPHGVRAVETGEISSLTPVLCVASPGVPPDSSARRECERLGIEQISEIELAFTYCAGDVLAVTGTNGKSTVTALLGSMLACAGYRSVACGNIGNAFSREVLARQISGKKAVYAVEVSSYQLELCKSFKPQVAVITNVTSDHLARHKTLENYADIKFSVFKNADENCRAVVNLADPVSASRLSRIPCPYIGFSHTGEGRCTVRNGWAVFDGKEVFSLEDIRIPGAHNVQNALAAAAAALAYGAPLEAVRAAIRGFGGLKHRLEHIADIDGVKVYNDSKATNIDSALTAVYALNSNTVLILGGSDKGEDFSRLFSSLPPRVKACVLTGDTAPRLLKSAKACGFDAVVPEPDFEKAVTAGLELCKGGDALLFSPACASFDRFINFEERGEKFAEIIKIQAGN